MASIQRTSLTLAGFVSLGAVLLCTLKQGGVPKASDCGPASLHALCDRIGISVSREQVFRLFPGGTDITSFYGLQQAARHLGVEMEPVEMSIADLRQQHKRGLLHIDGRHFVALLDFNDSGFTIADPVAPGVVDVQTWSERELRYRWDGRLLAVKSLLMTRTPRRQP